jgi:hypothetical protein
VEVDVGGLEVEGVEEDSVVHGERGPRRDDSRGIGGEAVWRDGGSVSGVSPDVVTHMLDSQFSTMVRAGSLDDTYIPRLRAAHAA